MIASVRLLRFKRFRDVEFRMRPLTVLTGANSAGKTSIIQAILLARQASMPGSGTVELNGPYGMRLGEATDLLNRTSGGDWLGLDLTDTDGLSASWRFSVGEERSLHLGITQFPEVPPGSLVGQGRAFTYLSAERMGPRDILGTDSVEVRRLGVGCAGEFTAQVLATLQRQRISQRRRAPSREKEAGLSDLLHQSELWMREVVHPIQIQADWPPGTCITRLEFKTPGLHSEWTRPPNMGFGVSYVLPVIVAGLLAESGGLLMVENPEAHLHPAGQSAIGWFLAHVASDGVQVLVETHSDHVLNGMRRAIATPPRVLEPEAIAVHFFSNEADPVASVQTIDATSTGSLSDWPRGFFDQIEQDLGALARARKARP